MNKHEKGASIRELAMEYAKPFKTINNMVTRENSKRCRIEAYMFWDNRITKLKKENASPELLKRAAETLFEVFCEEATSRKRM